MKTRITLFALGLIAAFPLPVQASTSDWTQTPGGRVRVIIEDGAVADGARREIRGALQIELEPGWKTYWRNPGDAGVPPQISLEGDAAAHIAFPAPVRFDEGGKDNGIGYKAPVSLPLTFALQPGDTRLKGNVFLGVCAKICIPVQAEFDFPLRASETPDAPQAMAARTIIETAFDRLPSAASPAFGVSTVKRRQNEAVFTLALPDPQAPAELFVASDRIGLSDPVSADGEGKRNFVVKLRGEAKDATVDYTIVQNGKAVSGQVTLD